jgi:hypothetical protein
MSLNEAVVEDAALESFGCLGRRSVKCEIGRVGSWSSFCSSLFTLHASPFIAIVCDALLVGRLSVELSVSEAKD